MIPRTVLYAHLSANASHVLPILCVSSVGAYLRKADTVDLFQLDEPFCRPFGNRRLMHCVNATSTTPQSNQYADFDEPRTPGAEGGKTIAWESCGRIPRLERADFFEFVACNIAFVIIALAMVLWRSRVVRNRQARVLAARIGLARGRRA